MADTNKEEISKGNEGKEQKNTETKKRNFFREVLCSPLTFLRCALFFWFMGANEVFVFSSVFLEQQGFTITHISLVTSISVGVQFFGTFFSGVIVDKFGRVKLILLTNIAVSILVSLAFVLLPSIQNCNETEYRLHCNNNTVVMKMRHPELCNSTENISLENCSSFHSVHISSGPNSTNCSEPDADELEISTEEFSALEKSINSTEKIHLVEPRKVIEYELKDSAPNCFRSKDQCSKVKSNNMLLLVLYGILICLFHTSRATTYRLYDFIAVTLSAQLGSDLGRQNMCGILGSVIGAPVVGSIIRTFPTDGRQNYSLAFLAYMLLAFLSGLLICKVDCQVKPPSQKVWKAFFSLLKKADMIMYLIVLFAIGTSCNFNLIYLGLFQEQLGSSAFVIGLTAMMVNACGLPFLLTARWWLQKLGTRTIFLLALFLSAFFHAAVSFVETSLPILFLVLVNIFTFHLLWVEAMNFARIIAPEEVSGTVVFIAGCVHFVVAIASASLIGGMVMSAYGARMANRVIGAMCLLTGILYMFFTCCSSKREEPLEQPNCCKNIA